MTKDNYLLILIVCVIVLYIYYKDKIKSLFIKKKDEPKPHMFDSVLCNSVEMLETQKRQLELDLKNLNEEYLTFNSQLNSLESEYAQKKQLLITQLDKIKINGNNKKSMITKAEIS